MKNLIILFVLLIFSSFIFSCSYEETDFGFDGAISGTVKDSNGTPLFADINSNTLVVKLLGEGDKQAIEVRVNGEGNYQNLKLFPKNHKVWIDGPILKSDTVTVDFNSAKTFTKDFTVTPMLSPKITNATPSGTTIKVDYGVVPNGGNTAKKMEIYCSTVKFPTATTGTLANVYFTKTVSITALTGSVTIDGLTSGKMYYVRIGAQAAASSLMNYSNQVIVTIP